MGIRSRNTFKKLVVIAILITLILWLNSDNGSLLKKFRFGVIKENIRLPQLKHRRDLATLMESMGGKKMVEVS